MDVETARKAHAEQAKARLNEARSWLDGISPLSAPTDALERVRRIEKALKAAKQNLEGVQRLTAVYSQDGTRLR